MSGAPSVGRVLGSTVAITLLDGPDGPVLHLRGQDGRLTHLRVDRTIRTPREEPALQAPSAAAGSAGSRSTSDNEAIALLGFTALTAGGEG